MFGHKDKYMCIYTQQLVSKMNNWPKEPYLILLSFLNPSQ